MAETPYPKKVLNLPIILSQEEVACLIDSAQTPFHRIVLMTLYATGVRRAELARLAEHNKGFTKPNGRLPHACG